MIVTFYSYKGGVGRSMAMANVADILARSGARVLMIDFDLEAPGLEQYFKIPQESSRAHEGLLDLLLAFKQSMAVGGSSSKADFRDVSRFILDIYQKLPGGGSLDLMPAGRREGADLEKYVTGVRAFDWQDFYFNWEGELFFEWLRDELTRERYDLVLVDSRTGVTEMGGICSYQLADQMVILCAANRQNLRGTKNVVEDFTSARVMARRQDRPLGIVVVPARIEQRDPKLLEQFLGEFESSFGGYFPASLRDAAVGVRELMIPYQADYAFEERVVTEPDAVKRADIGAAFVALAGAVTLLAPPGSRIAALGPSAEFEGMATTASYDVTTRFGGYDVHLAGSAANREELQRLRSTLESRGLQVFLDPLESVPPEEWLRRSEQILFHSRVLLVVSNDLTTAQRDALAALVRANQGAKNRPVVFVALGGEDDGALPRQLGAMNVARVNLAGWPREDTGVDALVRELEERGRTGVASRAAPPAQSITELFALSPSFGTDEHTATHPIQSGPPVTTDVTPAAEATATRHSSSAATVAVGQPFRGADPFREDGAGFFFGRERLVSDLVAAVETSNLVWLMGPSGCGKTSAVLAGVFPLLRAKAPERVLERIEVVPGCASTLADTLGRLPLPTPGLRHLLFVDDFERLGELPQRECDALYDSIASTTASRNARRDVSVLLGLREDGVRLLTDSRVPFDQASPNVVRVPDFTAGELRAAIERPAERGGLAYEPGLVDRIIADSGLQTSALSLVQKTLFRLWENRRDGWLTNAAYERMGGIGAVVVEVCDSALDNFSADDPILDDVFGRLVTFEDPAATAARPARSKGEPATGPAELIRRRFRVPVGDMIPANADPAPYRTTTEHLTRHGLLVAKATDDGEPCVELVHDAAFDRSTRIKTRLSNLFARDRDFLLWRQQLAGPLAKWRLSGSSSDTLSGGALRAAVRWLEQRSADLNNHERTFIARSGRAVWAQRVAVAVVATLIAVMFVFQWNHKREDEANVLLAEGDEQSIRQQWQAAIAKYDSAEQRGYPHMDSLLVRRARANDAGGDYKSAVADFSAALAINPASLETLAGRAGAQLRAGDYRSALQDFDLVIQKDSANASAYFGRAVARNRLEGNADSSLADLSRAFAVDSTRIDALFERGSLNQRLGRRDSAISDFRRVAAVATNPDDREAAKARLVQLSPPDTAAPIRPTTAQPVARTTIYIQYLDARDEKIVELIRSEIARAGAFDVPKPELVAAGRTVGDVRYLRGFDQYVKDVLVATERALAKNGYRVRLQTRALDSKEFSNFKPGRIEVWLPSLSQSLFSQEYKSN